MLKTKPQETIAEEKNLVKFPTEIFDIIAKQTPRAMAQLSATSKGFYYWYREDLSKIAAKQLMEYVLKPTEKNVKKAKAMIAANPKIMFIKTQGVEWASGVEGYLDAEGQHCIRAVPRRVKCSPFQAALGTGDKDLYEYMAHYSDKVGYTGENGKITETGIQRAQRQIQEQFPKGFDYPEVEKEFSELLAEIVNVISNDQSLIHHNISSPETKTVLKKFRDYLLPKEVTQGHHFNLNYLIEAFIVYNQNYDALNAYQRTPFWCQVIGYVERLVPVVVAQEFCGGIAKYQEKNMPFFRSLTLYNYQSYQSKSKIDYFSTIPNPTLSGLGFDFGLHIDEDCCWGSTLGGVIRVVSLKVLASLRTYVEEKQQHLTSFNDTLTAEKIQQHSTTFNNTLTTEKIQQHLTTFNNTPKVELIPQPESQRTSCVIL